MRLANHLYTHSEVEISEGLGGGSQQQRPPHDNGLGHKNGLVYIEEECLEVG